MPLHVYCPTGCLIRMSSNRAGKIVRCPKCKSPIRIPFVDEALFTAGRPVPCHARIAKKREEVVATDSIEGLEMPSEESSREVKPRLPVPELIKPVLKPRRRPLPEIDFATDSVIEAPVEAPVEEPVAPNVLLPSVPKPIPAAECPEESRAHDESGEFEIAAPSEELTEATAGIVAEPPPSRSPGSKSIEELATAATSRQDTVASSAPAAQRLESSTPPEGGSKKTRGAKKKRRKKSREKVKKTNSLPARDGLPDARAQSTMDAGQSPEIIPTELAASQALSQPADRSPDTLGAHPANPEDFESTMRASESATHLSVLEPISKPKGSASSIPVVNLSDPLDEPPFVPQEKKNWEEKLANANSDRRILARFFALCLCLVAIVNMIPAIYHWYQWTLNGTEMAETMALPRWIYILIFVGAIHLVYAIFLFQVNDWSAMRAVSIAMLAVAFVFGFVSTSLLMGGGQSNLSGILGIPYTLNRQACVWCVAMLCLATLMSYWGGKEASHWQRTEDLLKDILTKSPA